MHLPIDRPPRDYKGDAPITNTGDVLARMIGRGMFSTAYVPGALKLIFPKSLEDVGVILILYISLQILSTPHQLSDVFKRLTPFEQSAKVTPL